MTPAVVHPSHLSDYDLASERLGGSTMWGGVLVFLCITVLWIGGLWWAYEHSKRGRIAANWPTVDAHVTSSMVSDAGGMPSAIVVYEYEVDGKRHRSTRLRYGGASMLRQVEADALGKRYAKGTTCKAYVNPDNPREAVLEPHAPPHRGLLWVLRVSGGAWLLLTALMFLLAVTS